MDVDAEVIRKELTSPYYVAFLDDSKSEQLTVVRVKDFSSEEFSEFVRARESIDTNVLQYMDLYLMVAIMYDNLANAYEKRLNTVKQQGNINAREDLAELNAYFSALIANIGMYLSCVPRKISSKRKSIHDVHIKATREEYDAHFPYRLFCALRNYALHNTPPITGIRGSSRLSDDPSNPKVDYEIYIEKSQLLKDKQIAKKLAGDFASSQEHYPVMEYAEEAMRCLKNIHWKTIKALVTSIDGDIEYIKSLVNLTSKHRKPPIIAALTYNAKSKGMDARIELIPTQIVEISSKSLEY